jgi:hypothetical protein
MKMPEVKRYGLVFKEDGYDLGEFKDGGLVRYSDYQKVKELLDEIKERLEIFNQGKNHLEIMDILYKLNGGE